MKAFKANTFGFPADVMLLISLIDDKYFLDGVCLLSFMTCLTLFKFTEKHAPCPEKMLLEAIYEISLAYFFSS